MGPPYHVAKRAVKILGEISDVGRREDLFFGLHPRFGGKLEVGRREDLFFLEGLHPRFGGKLDVGAPEDDFGGGHALPSFGPVYCRNLSLF